MTSAVWGSQWFILQAHVYTPAIQVKHVPAMCTFQEHSRGEVEGGSDSSITREGGRAAQWPDLGSIYFGEIWTGSIQRIGMLSVRSR